MFDEQLSVLEADPDQDGLSNLMEYALGKDPRAYSPAAPQVGPLVEGALSLIYERPAERPNLDYRAETSVDLVSWSEEEVQLERVETGDIETWRAFLSIKDESPRFLRLVVKEREE